MIILGIDPGTASMGYGIIKKTSTLKCLDYDVIHTEPNSDPGKRLKKISNKLSRIIRQYKPEVLAVERVYFFKNLKTVIPVSQAKGVVLLAAAKKNLIVREFSPPEIKLAITGNGRADKKEIQENVKKMLKLKKIPKPDDAADALATAITYVLKKA